MKVQTIAAAVGAALIFGAGWAVNGWRLGQDIAQIQLVHTQELAARDAGAFAVAQAIGTNYQGDSMHPFKNKRAWLALLLLPLAMLAGCASNSLKPTSELPQLPSPPSESTPQPPISYSDSAATDTQSWQQKLTDTLLMREPVGQPGQ